MEMNEEHAASAAHHPPGRDRRIDASREQACDPTAGSDRKSTNVVVVAVPEPKPGATGAAAQSMAVLLPRQGQGGGPGCGGSGEGGSCTRAVGG